MNSIIDHEKVNVNGKTTVDFHYFIQSAVQKNISWNALAMFLTDLAPTLDQSREVIKILVQELEKWATKVENQGKDNEELLEPQLGKNLLNVLDICGIVSGSWYDCVYLSISQGARCRLSKNSDFSRQRLQRRSSTQSPQAALC